MQFATPSLASAASPASRPGRPALQRRPLKARSSYPTLSLVRLGRSPLQKLAWIFGFGR